MVFAIAAWLVLVGLAAAYVDCARGTRSFALALALMFGALFLLYSDIVLSHIGLVLLLLPALTLMGYVVGASICMLRHWRIHDSVAAKAEGG